MSAPRPRVVARWEMTANGVALTASDARLNLPAPAHDRRPRLRASDVVGLREELAALAEQGVAEAVVEGDATRVWTALAADLVDVVSCDLEALVALRPMSVVTGGAGVSHMDEAVRLSDVEVVFDGACVRIKGTVVRRA